MDSSSSQPRSKGINSSSTGESTSSSTLPEKVRETVKSLLPSTTMIGGGGTTEEKISSNPEEIVRIIFEKVFTMDNSMEYAHHLMKQYIDKDATIVGAFPGQKDYSLESYRLYFDEVKHALPDINTVCYDMGQGIGANGKTVIFTRYLKLGRFAGGKSLMGFTPTHSRIEERGVAFVRFNAQCKIEYMEIYPNDFELLSYMGLNLYGKLPATPLSLTGPQGLLAREPLGTNYSRTAAVSSAPSTAGESFIMAHLPPKVTESFATLRDNLNEAAATGKEELVHLSNKLRDLFSSYTPSAGSTSGDTMTETGFPSGSTSSSFSSTTTNTTSSRM